MYTDVTIIFSNDIASLVNLDGEEEEKKYPHSIVLEFSRNEC